MKNLTIALTLFIAFAVTLQQPAVAVEPLSSDELASHCDYYRKAPTDKDGIFCVRYIQGFIDGAVATDERVTLNVANEYDEEESFSQRAIRIRLGQRLDSFGSSYYAEFCLGAPIPLAEVVETVVSRLDEKDFQPQNKLARVVVYKVLRDKYPCKSKPNS